MIISMIINGKDYIVQYIVYYWVQLRTILNHYNIVQVLNFIIAKNYNVIKLREFVWTV